MPFLLKNCPNSNKVEKGHILPLNGFNGLSFVQTNVINDVMMVRLIPNIFSYTQVLLILTIRQIKMHILRCIISTQRMC